MKTLIDPALQSMSKTFDKLYADAGRQSISPEYLLKATLLQMMYSIRSEWLLVDQIDYNLPFRWFIGLSMVDNVWIIRFYQESRSAA